MPASAREGRGVTIKQTPTAGRVIPANLERTGKLVAAAGTGPAAWKSARRHAGVRLPPLRPPSINRHHYGSKTSILQKRQRRTASLLHGCPHRFPRESLPIHIGNPQGQAVQKSQKATRIRLCGASGRVRSGGGRNNRENHLRPARSRALT